MDYEAFSRLRDDLRLKVAEWTAALPGLREAQAALAEELARSQGTGVADYPLETAIVYNLDLDAVRPDSGIKWLVVADNPGKKEQLRANRRYLVGASGKQAENFFARELGTDFRAQTVILNKTPIHTPKTIQLKALVRLYPEAAPVLEASQGYMAEAIPAFSRALDAPVWIMGLSEARKGGLFGAWRDRLAERYMEEPASGRERVYAFAHFSMGRFAVELKSRRAPSESTRDAVLRIGAENRKAVFGF